MKKLLILLSVLTISGTTIPIVIASSSYQKETKSKINKRQKRNNNENISETKVVIKANLIIKSAGIILNNKVYFGSSDHNVYEYDPKTEQQKIVIRTNGEIWFSGVVFNNKLYFGTTDKNFYEYDPITEQQKIIFTTNSWNESSGVVLNNKLYFGSADGNVYEYSEYSLNTNLWQINDNSNNAILNELNYLNRNLDISQLEIVNKTDISATIKTKNNSNHFNAISVNYKIKNNNEISVINLNELIKKAVFFKFRDENPNLKFNKINYINTNNLNFKNIEAKKTKI